MQEEILIKSPEQVFIAVKNARDLSSNKILDGLKKADLKGMGGAGFPTWVKWNAANCTPCNLKYVVANGHEGEPFTLKDKFLLGNFPHQIIGGMLIAAQAISSKKLTFIINGSYKEEMIILKKALKDFKKKGLLKDIDVTLAFAKNLYIGGEESALLNELEGKRIEPRAKMPLVCSSGLNGAPTIVDNVETFAQVPYIFLYSAKEYKKNAKKIITVAGDVKDPGVYGIKLSEPLSNALKLAGGVCGQPKFAIVGGYSGNVILPKNFKNSLSFDFTMNNIFLGAGTIVVFNQKTRVIDVLKSLFEFYKNESCGQCTPCREGTMKLYEIVKYINDKISKVDKQRIDEIIAALDSSSFCTFGQCVGMAAKGLFKNFGKEILSAK